VGKNSGKTDMINIGDTSYMGTLQNDFKSEITIGKYCSIGNNLKIISAEHPSSVNRQVVSNYPFAEKLNINYPKCRVGESVKIGNDVWIGENVIMIAPIIIGDGAIIGAGSVIKGNIEPYSVVVGNPAKIVRYKFNPDQIEKLKNINWWNWLVETIKERIEDFKDIEIFLQKYG
jgi:acetyltransferase-like isoleucine patch superfamily enzyme